MKATMKDAQKMLEELIELEEFHNKLMNDGFCLQSRKEVTELQISELKQKLKKAFK